MYQSLSDGDVSVYLPKHPQGWKDYFTGKHYDGGQTITTAVAADYIPVFVRAGSIIPVKDDEVLLYPGVNGTFTLYEDDGVSRAYEKGQSSHITFHWNDAQRQLTIAKRVGKYQNMPARRTFKITLPGGQQTSVAYQGKKTAKNF